MQENNNTTTEKRGRGRPPKDDLVNLPVTHQPNSTENNEELELLRQQLQRVTEERDKLKQIAETVAITNTKNLVECTDDEINSLYIDYLTHHELANANAIIIEVANKIIIPKSYYVIG